MSSIVSCKEISKKFGDTQILKPLTFEVKQGELFFLLGPSGCGKTTLLRIIAGLLQQDSGQLEVAGRNMAGVPPEQRGIGMVFQNYALWPHLNVKQHIEFGLKNQKLSSLDIEARTTKILDLLQINDLALRFPHELSGGQQQRVSLARALAPQPKLLLLDEPLSNLDPTLREEMRLELKKVQRELGLTFIYVTHDRSEALAIGDRIAILNQGKLEQLSTPLDMYFKPKNAFVAEFLGETNLLQGKLLSNKDGFIDISSELGVFTQAQSSDLVQPGQEILLSLRPEDIVIEQDFNATNSESKIAGVVTSIVPLGVISQVKVKLASNREIICSVSMRESLDLKEGIKVLLSSSSEKISILG